MNKVSSDQVKKAKAETSFWKKAYRGWMRFGLFLGHINAIIILTLVFWIMFIPTRLIGRLFGYRFLQLKFDPELDSYRSEVDINEFSNSYERPF